jgi:hypothetical protein
MCCLAQSFRLLPGVVDRCVGEVTLHQRPTGAHFEAADTERGRRARVERFSYCRTGCGDRSCFELPILRE